MVITLRALRVNGVDHYIFAMFPLPITPSINCTHTVHGVTPQKALHSLIKDLMEIATIITVWGISCISDVTLKTSDCILDKNGNTLYYWCTTSKLN